MEVTLGGDRLGSGAKNKVQLKNFERSTHDMSYVWRSTMASGTIVPFLTEVALPGDTFDIDLGCDIKTHPTIGPLFGSYKVQLDVFQTPIRLYQAELYMNKLKIGLDMSNVVLPQILMQANSPTANKPIDNQQINPSCIFSYLNMRGLGSDPDNTGTVRRVFNGISWLIYWECVKNYYANKQEEIAYVIHNPLNAVTATVISVDINAVNISAPLTASDEAPTTPIEVTVSKNTSTLVFKFNAAGYQQFDLERISIWWDNDFVKPEDLFANWEWDDINHLLTGSQFRKAVIGDIGFGEMGTYLINTAVQDLNDTRPNLVEFPLENIDDMRTLIMQWPNPGVPFQLDDTSIAPYGLANHTIFSEGKVYWSKMSGQEGLAVKTYQSDLFNNWMSTEWIDGAGGINEITSIDTTGGSITINEINMQQKVYEYLNSIAITGGTWEDWQDATYTHERRRSVNNPMYAGGLSKELVFDEVVSTAENGNQPLGTLAGRGTMARKHKGGRIKIKIDEPSYITAYISLTPRIDYSQGNKWDTNIFTMNDLHKPAMDEIGFQDLITDQMAWFDTTIPLGQNPIFKSAGKQPAWINYMTNVNQIRGNFAEENDQMFMVLNRRYEPNYIAIQEASIKDLTTYIDPAKFNHIFADTRLDAQNFWAQIAVNMTVRRKMSAKVMPRV